jgi:hypothetical protein
LACRRRCPDKTHHAFNLALGTVYIFAPLIVHWDGTSLSTFWRYPNCFQSKMIGQVGDGKVRHPFFKGVRENL